jgi:peptidoglycan/xylan/chitin deacetylase (PgdA/CDA1 family)
MYHYFVHPPSWIRNLFPRRIWRINRTDRTIYLTFDDGPHPTITPFVLDLLKKYNAKASFFCIGQRVKEFPAIYERILQEGHRVGNHTYSHLNGWKTGIEEYEEDIRKASRYIETNLFRPPYGRMRTAQARRIGAAMQQNNARIVMWDILSGDFDTTLKGDDCFKICQRYLRPGSIIVLHDSEKAWDRLHDLLPMLLEQYSAKGYSFKALP